MTVEELIERLREMPSNARVLVRDRDGDLDSVYSVELLQGDVQTVYVSA